MEKPTILYVDDEEINLRIFKNTFRREYKIHVALSALEGLRILDQQPVDLVITDQRMPEMTGLGFLKQVHARYPKIPPPRLMISGYSDQDAIDEAFEKYDLFSFISKPWDADRVKEIMDKALSSTTD